MNNLTIGGIDPRTGGAVRVLRNDRGRNGSAADERRRLRRAHTHDELPEHARRGSGVRLSVASSPVFACGRDSGGVGRYRGGDGVVREIEVLTDAEVTLLADRRTTRAVGIAGRHKMARREKPPSCVQTVIAGDLPGKFNVRLQKGNASGLNPGWWRVGEG